jgi:ABC-2 type transport system permease protein
VADEAPAAAERLLAGTTVTIISTESGREYPNGGDPTLGLFFPLIAAVFFIFLMITTAGYMTSVLVEEKVNRTVEIVFTSISTGRLMTGKILGALGIAGLQLAVWLLFLAGAIVVGGQVLDIGWMQDLSLNWRDVLAVIVVALPTYFFAATLMALIGSMLADTMEAQQAASLSMIFLFLPIYLIVPVIGNPDGLLAQALTFFPLTSLLTLGMRSLVMVVPTWQVAVAAVTALLGSLFLVWLASRAFRLSMLRYGQRLRLRELLRRGGSNRERAGGPAASSA